MERSEFLSKYADSLSKIVEIAKRLHAKNYLAAFDGNISFKIDDSMIAITPTARAKAFLLPEDMVLMNLNGETHYGEASGEKWMHLEVYRRAPLAKAVVHAHPPMAIAWSVAFPNDRLVPNKILSELVLAVGAIPIVPFQIPGTLQMGEALCNFLPEYQTLILARHGALAWGSSLEEAYFGIERIEHAVTVLAAAKQLGNLSEMDEASFLRLSEMRSKMKKGIY